jgi:hypothetical protein
MTSGERMRNSSRVDGDEDMTETSKLVSSYKVLYMIVGGYAIMTSLLHYPFQKYLKSHGVDEDEISSYRLIFYIPWIIKPIYAILGDLLYPMRYRTKGWIVLLCCTNILAALYFIATDNVDSAIYSTVLIINNLVFLESIGQALRTSCGGNLRSESASTCSMLMMVMIMRTSRPPMHILSRCIRSYRSLCGWSIS